MSFRPVDPVTRPVSEYALAKFRWLATAGTSRSVGVIALAVALLLEPAVAGRVERAAAMLLVVVGALKLAMPLFPVDAIGTPATRAGQLNNILGNLTFFLFPLAALLLFRALGQMGSRLAPAMAVVLAVATVEVLVGNAIGWLGFAACLPGSVRALAAPRRFSGTSQPSLSRSSMKVVGPDQCDSAPVEPRVRMPLTACSAADRHRESAAARAGRTQPTATLFRPAPARQPTPLFRLTSLSSPGAATRSPTR